MKFMLLLWGDESQWEGMSDEDTAADMERWDAYSKELVDAGAMVSGEGLQPSATSRILRVEGGDTIVTDGPFAETKEQLGGFYVIDCASLEQAMEWAAKVPSAERGTTEVRPVIDYEAYASGDAAERVETQS
jgi:hypothetical protein